MKKLLICLSVLVMACGGDDPNPYSFKNQTAQGRIENVAWVFVEGTAEDNGDDLSIDLLLDQANDPCIGFPDGDMVFFHVPDAVGLYKLKLGSNGQTVTLFDTEEFYNIISTEGAIEILTITETEVTGRIDARFDKKNYVNGNFIVSKCP